MQMIWLMGATAPAKKVHFNLNGCELRGFPIKARFGQSSILYANPLAPRAVACFYLCPAVITTGQCAHGRCLSKLLILILCTISIPVVCTLHSGKQQSTTPLTFHDISLLFCKSLGTCVTRAWTLACRMILTLYSDRPASHAGNHYYFSFRAQC